MISNIEDWLSNYQPDGSIIERVLWIFWAVWVLLILAAVFRVIKFRLGLNREERIWKKGFGEQKPAAVIVPIKGAAPNQTSDFFQSLLEQDYPNYRLIVTVEAGDDPAALWLSEQLSLTPSQPVWASGNASGLQSIQLVVAGKSQDQGQKVHNQLAAFQALTDNDQVIVFVDADINCPPDWLAKLAHPINANTFDISTTYRWLVPEKNSLANRLASVINASVTTQGGNTRDNMPWGGSTAIGLDTFLKLDVPGLFAGCLNDDLRLGKAAKRAGYKVGYLRSLVRPTDINYTWSSFMEFARRQYFQLKIFAPILYFASNLIFSLYFWGLVSILVAIGFGYLWAWIPLILVTVLDQVRASTRESIYRKLFGHIPDVYKRIAKCGPVEHLMTPFYMLVHGWIILSTWFMSKMEWGGVKYHVKGVGKTRVLGRKESTATPNLASIGQLVLPTSAIAAATADVTKTEKVPANESSDSVADEKPAESNQFDLVAEDKITPPVIDKPAAPEVTASIDKPDVITTDKIIDTDTPSVKEPEPQKSKPSKSPLSSNVKGIGSGAVIMGGAGLAAASLANSKEKESEASEDETENISKPVLPPTIKKAISSVTVAAVPHAPSAVRMIGSDAVLPFKNQIIPRANQSPIYKSVALARVAAKAKPEQSNK